MGRRLGGLAAFLVVLATGALIGSGFAQYMRTPNPAVEPVDPVPSLGRIRVEVRNGGGKSGMARAATDRLRDLGFDVVVFGNADRFDHPETVVIDRVGRLDKARAVANALGAGSVTSDPDEELYLDVTVVLGSDWHEGLATGVEEEDDRPWWDLSRWLRETVRDHASEEER